MTVLLGTSVAIPDAGSYDSWCALGAAPAALDPGRRVPGLAARLEEAFDAVAGEWLALGRQLGAEPTATLAHAPACTANVSDLGLMLAWSRLAGSWMEAPGTTLVICDDPWMFRHLSALGATAAGPPPALWRAEAQLRVRGFLARCRVAARLALACLRLAGQRKAVGRGGAALLVYGHPASGADGVDGYFGPLMRDMPALGRVLHVDCGAVRAVALAADRRTASLHAWGRPGAALGLPFARWRPAAAGRSGPVQWIVRRAAALEGGTGQAAMLRWQVICQDSWLRRARPAVIAWPWENHAWERDLVRRARRAGVRTVGYQHATVGRREWNYSPASNPDGMASIPDRILCSGPAGRQALVELGYPDERLAIGGVLRTMAAARLRHDPSGPVFVALPFDHAIAAEMIDAVRPLGARGWRFLIRDHPMTPFPFAEGPGVVRSAGGLGEQAAGLAAVLYAATTVGLEAALGGLPTLRFQPRGRVPVDVFPAAVAVPAATAETLEETLRRLRPPADRDPAAVFSPADRALWAEALAP